jgi:hypothetical protein
MVEIQDMAKCSGPKSKWILDTVSDKVHDPHHENTHGFYIAYVKR